MSFPSLAASNSCLHKVCHKLAICRRQGLPAVCQSEPVCKQHAKRYLSSPVACSMSSAVMTPEEKVLEVLQRLLGRNTAVICCTCSSQTALLTDISRKIKCQRCREQCVALRFEPTRCYCKKAAFTKCSQTCDVTGLTTARSEGADVAKEGTHLAWQKVAA